jgi:hypothetical protein
VVTTRLASLSRLNLCSSTNLKPYRNIFCSSDSERDVIYSRVALARGGPNGRNCNQAATPHSDLLTYRHDPTTYTYAMIPSAVLEAVLSAAESGDLTQLQNLYRPGMSLEEVAKQAAQHKQPHILEWCYAHSWTHAAESFNSNFFIHAASGASSAIFQVLVDHGWDLNAHYTEYCGDALAMAIMGGEYDFAKWLLEHRHDSTPRGGIHGPEPITETVCRETGSIEMLKLLLAHGISLEETGVGIVAADEGNLEALRLLLDHGLDLEDRSMIGYPFDDDRDEPEESCGTALYRACRQGHFECVELLLGRGADPQARDDGGTSCFGIAKKRSHREVVELLEKRGVTE